MNNLARAALDKSPFLFSSWNVIMNVRQLTPPSASICFKVLAQTPTPFQTSLHIQLATHYAENKRDLKAAEIELNLARRSLTIRKRVVGGNIQALEYWLRFCQAEILRIKFQVSKARKLYIGLHQKFEIIQDNNTLSYRDNLELSPLFEWIASLSAQRLVDLALCDGHVDKAEYYFKIFRKTFQHRKSNEIMNEWIPSTQGWIHFLHAKVENQQGKKNELMVQAELNTKKSIAASPTSSVCLCRMGQILWEKAYKHRTDKAQGCFNYWLQAVKSDNQNSDAFACIGRYYMVFITKST